MRGAPARLPHCSSTLPSGAPGLRPSIQLQLRKLPKLPSAFLPEHRFSVSAPSLPHHNLPIPAGHLGLSAGPAIPSSGAPGLGRSASPW